MGFLDSIKRWQLVKKGFSHGKKRRVHEDNAATTALEESFIVRIGLYATFVVCSVILVLNASSGAAFVEDPFRETIYGVTFALAAVVMLHMAKQEIWARNSRIVLVLGGMIGHLLFVRVVMSLADAGTIQEPYRFLYIPFALAPILHGVLLGRAVGAYSAVYVSLAGALLVPANDIMSYIMISLAAGMAGVLASDKLRKRISLLRAGFYVGLVTLLLALLLGELPLFSLFGSEPMDRIQVLGVGAAIALGIALATTMIIGGLLPIFEGGFQLTTDISWLELSDLNHRLLKRMQLEAPGTFHHSLVVAALSEAAAESIGANAPMCRVSAYFHDVGKMKKPEYFIENQNDERSNPHDTLTPTMSALIIIAHVKDGIDLAVKHKLNPRIIDVIQEHHGDSLVYYFYRKAQEQKKAEMEKVDRKLENPEDLPKIQEKNFRYPGPCPRTRESGIICLADTIESASRTLRKPTPGKIRALVDDLVKAKINDGQLDECPLTFGELAKVKASFAKTLSSMLHSRIAYQKPPEEKGENRENGSGRSTKMPATDRIPQMDARKSNLTESDKQEGRKTPVA